MTFIAYHTLRTDVKLTVSIHSIAYTFGTDVEANCFGDARARGAISTSRGLRRHHAFSHVVVSPSAIQYSIPPLQQIVELTTDIFQFETRKLIER